MKILSLIFFVILAVSLFAGTNPGIPSLSITESKLHGLFISQYNLTQNNFVLGNQTFPISEAWLEAASEDGQFFGKNKKDGYVVVLRIEPSTQRWPFQPFTLWCPGAEYGDSVGITTFSSGLIIIHTEFRSIPKDVAFKVKSEIRSPPIYSIQLTKK